MIGLAGRSGEGKSTLLHVLGTLLVPPTADNSGFQIAYQFPGEIDPGFVYDLRSHDASVQKLRNTAFGFVFQQHFNLPCMSTVANVALPHLLRPSFSWKLAQPRCRSLLTHLKLDDVHYNKYPAELSGGMNQRVAIGRALMHQPPFLFADEPTASLDAGLKTTVLTLLRKHADLGACVIIVSHELGDLARYCDRILVVGGGQLRFPFRDPDSDQDSALPALPELPSVESSQPRFRNDEAVRHVLQTITPHIWSEPSSSPPSTDHKSVCNGVDSALTVPASLSPHHGGRPAMRKNIWAFAFREVWGRRHRMAHLMTAVMVVLGTAVFTYLADLSRGVVSYIKNRDLSAPDEFINRIYVDASSNKNRLTDTQAQFLSDIKGLRAPPTFYQSGEAIYFLPPMRTNRNDAVRAEVVSVPIGDDALKSVHLHDRQIARLGVCYLTGGPFLINDRDRAGIIVSRRFLRTRYWNIDDEDRPASGIPDPETFPSYLIVQLPGGGRWDPPGFNGRVKIPINGVFEYPAPIIATAPAGKEQYLPGMFVPEGFYRRLSTWDPSFPLVYPSVEGHELVADYQLVRQITFSIPKAADASWSKTESRGWYYLRHIFRDVPLNPMQTQDGSLQVTLAFDQSEHRVAPEGFEKTPESNKLRKIIEEDAKGGPAKVSYDTISAQSIARNLPPLDTLPPQYTRVLLRFTDMHDVPPALDSIRQKYGREMESEAPFAEAISKFSNIEKLMSILSLSIFILFVTMLTYVCVTTAFQHVLKKTSDIGILRVHGMSPVSIALVYLVELAMLICPAAIAGLILATACAWLTNDTVATWVGGIGTPKSLLDSNLATSSPAVFASLQEGWLRSILNLLILSTCVFSVVSATTLFTVRLIRRKQIVQCLRGGE
ncbi:hypothetical protein FTUN_0714 [Frigoriglobus tundricola]|uniref:ABC transporter domain-containing protein n=2 Tax=Frigoriglobus tundricola TaxID=2774151 RepID=A0A6M5YGP1_9BACT|nr:hypothetical protein FTUN_0714 [Frigoriglobus tundricola]